MDKQTEFYINLKKRLQETTQFPTHYLYKFIIPAKGTQLSQIKHLFLATKTTVNTKFSKNMKYISVSIKVLEQNAEDIIERYQSVRHIKGIVSL